MDEVILQSVVDRFKIEGRGTVLTGPIGAAWPLAKKGDRIELRTPEGRCIQTVIKDVEMFRKGDWSQEPIPNRGVLLAEAFTLDEVPRGTVMFRIADDSAA